MSAVTNQEVAIVKAEEVGAVLATQTEGEKQIAESQIQAKVVELINKSRAAANFKLKEATQQAEVMGIEAESKLLATKAQYAALSEEGRSEAKNLEAFEAQRRHAYEMNRAKVFEELALNQKNIVMSGKTGDAILHQLLDFSIDEKKKQL